MEEWFIHKMKALVLNRNYFNLWEIDTFKVGHRAQWYKALKIVQKFKIVNFKYFKFWAMLSQNLKHLLQNFGQNVWNCFNVLRIAYCNFFWTIILVDCQYFWRWFGCPIPRIGFPSVNWVWDAKKWMGFLHFEYLSTHLSAHLCMYGSLPSLYLTTAFRDLFFCVW